MPLKVGLPLFRLALSVYLPAGALVMVMLSGEVQGVEDLAAHKVPLFDVGPDSE